MLPRHPETRGHFARTEPLTNLHFTIVNHKHQKHNDAARFKTITSLPDELGALP